MSKVYWPLYEVFVRSKQGLSIVTSAVCTLPMIKWRWRMPAMPTPPQRGCSIWVVKASEIVASQPEDRSEFFGQRKASLPSSDFLYRAGRHGTYEGGDE